MIDKISDISIVTSLMECVFEFYSIGQNTSELFYLDVLLHSDLYSVGAELEVPRTCAVEAKLW